MKSSNAHLVDDEECGKRCVTMSYVERNGFAVILSQAGFFRVIEKDKLLRLLDVQLRIN